MNRRPRRTDTGDAAATFMNMTQHWPVLADSQIEELRQTALAFIEDHGFAVHDDKLLAQARERGAAVDEVQGRVRVPRKLVAELLSTLPCHYTVGNILGETWEVGGGRQHGVAIVTDPWIVDYATQSPRRPGLEDVRRHTIIAQKLDDVRGVSLMDFPVTDHPGPHSSLRALETHLLNHARHYHLMAASLESFEHWVELMGLMAPAGDIGPLVTSAVALGSPLVLNAANCTLLRRSIDCGFAIQPTICPMAGSTSPYSLAGTLLQAHIEVLMIALMSQLRRPGHPVIYATGLSVTDLQNGADLYYTIDKVLWKNAAVQLARAERMPGWAECGGAMTHRCDVQTGAEGMLFMLAAHASGADILSGFGSYQNAMGMSAEMMVIQASWLRAARHLTRGIRTDELRLAAPNLRQAGPGGQLLDDDLTLALMRSDEIFGDRNFDLTGGHGPSRAMLERAHDHVEQLVSGYESPVPHRVRERLQRHFHQLYAKMP